MNDVAGKVTYKLAAVNNTFRELEAMEGPNRVARISGNHITGYDLNGNGVIEDNEMALLVVISGYEAAIKSLNNADPESLNYAHYNNFLNINLSNNIMINSFAVVAEKGYVQTIENLGHIAHELCHYLGVPDLYEGNHTPETGWAAYQPDYLTLMSSGTYGEDGLPYSMDIWSKYWLGWVEPVLLTGEASSDLLSAGTQDADGTPRALRINIPGKEEYYLLENRQFEGWDATLGNHFPGEKGGIILWHIDTGDFQSSKYYCSSVRQPGVTPLYREEDYEGNISLISYKVLHQYPFFDRTIQETVYENVNGYLNLPVYGPNPKDSPLRRTYSDIGIKFTSESGTRMSVQIKDDNHIWNTGEVTEKPTTTTTGVRTYTCTVCQATKTESIPELKANPLTVKTSSKTYNYAKLTKAVSFAIGAGNAEGAVTYTPDAAAKKAKITVKNGTVTIPKNCPAGVYRITVKAAGNDTYAAGSKTVKITITKAVNPLKLKVSSKTYRRTKLTKAATFLIRPINGKGKITYKLTAKAKAAKIKVTTKGNVTIPKKCRKGKYIINVKAAGTKNYKAGTKKFTIIVK